MKTAVKNINGFLEYIKNGHLEEIIEQSQTMLIDAVSFLKFNPAGIKTIAISSIDALFEFNGVKKGPYFHESNFDLNKRIAVNECCRILVEITQKKLLIQSITDFTSSAEEAVNIMTELENFYSVRQADSVKFIFDDYKNLELELKEQEKETIKIAKESQHFAYAASHDLQEPLRMITSYLQIVSSRYADKLDPEGVEFIGYALDGSSRMKNLINGLLEFSRLNNITDLKKMNTNATLSSVLETLSFHIKESNAEIKSDDLPEITADPNLITKLFQHLISNAIKFKNTDPLKIKISVEKLDSAYRFAIQDNGIGIQKEYFEKIFVIFQRLHSKNKYPGTGIGLALCKKIVEQHGGTMWVESELDKGTTFYFTIPFEPVLTKKRAVD
ncbi:MAG TPA: ATP-binding protein [Chitinophagales bacterium]|nr:ATP-binding protein [Chitinophagales bacterium]